MDMSRWNADVPGTTVVWWQGQQECVPAIARQAFQVLLSALTVHNAGAAGNLWGVCYAASDLIDMLPSGPVAAPIRERVGQVLPDGRLRNMVRPSAFSSLTESQNLILGLNNLMKLIGGGYVPLNHRNL